MRLRGLGTKIGVLIGGDGSAAAHIVSWRMCRSGAGTDFGRHENARRWMVAGGRGRGL